MDCKAPNLGYRGCWCTSILLLACPLESAAALPMTDYSRSQLQRHVGIDMRMELSSGTP